MSVLQILLIVLLSLGALQGILYGLILILGKNANKKANSILGVILLFFSYRLVVEILQLFGLGYYDTWYHIFLEYNWVYGALIYFFVSAYTNPAFKFKNKDWIHFLPVLIEFVWSNFIKSQNFYWEGTRESLSWLGYWGYVVWMQYPTMYLVCGTLIIFYSLKAEKLIKQMLLKNVEVPKHKLKWITRVLKVLRIYAITFMIITLVDLILFDYAFDGFYYYPLFIGLAIITYWLGIEGYNRRNTVVLKQKNLLSKKEKEQLEQIASQLKQLMIKEKPYLNPNLTLRNLAESLNIKSYLLTKCLNMHLDKKFSTFINEYRIKELKELLKNPENKNFTLLGLAFDVGFNSKASFNRAVKKITGNSPSYLKPN